MFQSRVGRLITRGATAEADVTNETADIPSQRSGIRAVALAAGVSVSTVSRALNGYNDVNSETRRKIEETAESLGYKPNYAASMLRRNQTNTVTFVVSKPWTKYVDPYFLGILDGLEMVLSAQGYDLQVVMAREFEKEIEVIRRAVDRNRCDALIFARTRPEDERVDWLEERNFPFITIGQTRRNSHSFVDRDQHKVGRESVRRLAALGHKRIGHLTAPLRYTYTHNSIAGFRQGLDMSGLSFDSAHEVECFLSRRTGEEVVTELFTKASPPTALVCGNDLIAISAMDGLNRLGIRPGVDVALIGCDDMPIAAYVRPALTSYSQDLGAIGMRLGRMILARLGGDQTIEQNIIDTFLVIRESDCPGGSN
jgi:LacI family transcriptional regulator